MEVWFIENLLISPATTRANKPPNSMAPSTKLKQFSMDSFFPSKQPSILRTETSDYEFSRQENILRNQAFLKSLGITTPFTPNHRPRAKRQPRPPPPISAPLRRSARKQGLSPPNSPDSLETLAPESNDSAVFRYACHAPRDNGQFSVTGSSVAASMTPIVGFEVVGKAFRDPLLSKIYTLDVYFLEERRFLIAAGGHGGFISVYGGEDEVVDAEEAAEVPLMRWKGSQSWISGVMFAENNPMLLITSSNDGKLLVWDIKKQQRSDLLSKFEKNPLLVAQSDELHSGGIFSMHLSGCFIATSSKDSSVCLSRLGLAGELVVERNVSGHHSGVSRGVCFREDKDTLADCGADRCICVLDTRSPKPCVLTIETLHLNGVNTAEWCPSNRHLLLSSSKDPTLLLYDIRNSNQPFHKLQGHVETNSKACNQIYKPTFVDGGRTVATPGQRSRKISLYSVDAGKLLSQGAIGYDANVVKFTDNGAGRQTLWAAGRQIHQLGPLRHLEN